jgi:thiol-disulfide isomerase/thioredoxin
MTAAPTTEASPAARSHRRRQWLPILGAVALGAGLLAFERSSSSSGADDPTPAVAPAFTLPDVRDPSITVSLPTGRPVIVNFFAAWCVPCRDELPALEDAYRRHRADIDVVGVDVADSRTRAVDLLDATGVTFPTGSDPSRTVADQYRLAGMPTTVFVGADGRVVGTVRGPLDLDELDTWVERLRKAA